jgi:putative phage-type endonuclease
MKTLNVTQGSEEWHDIRSKRFTASEAPAMMGASKYMKREDLLHQKATGHVPNVSSSQQAIFNRGHEAEALARPIAEKIAGEELYPCTCDDDDGWLLASMDGLDMFETLGFEHKLLNTELREATAETLDDHYKYQMDHQMLVTGVEKILFMASDGTEENCVWFWYERDEKRIADVIEGWKIFEQDLANYQPAEAVVQLEGKTPENLPALDVRITVGVTASNLPAYKEHALAVFEGINTDLNTDQDFADAEKTVKWCKSVEDKLELTKEQALSQTADIEELMRTIDDLKDTARKTRLNLNRQVESRKKEIRENIAVLARSEFEDYVNAVNAKLSPCRLPSINCDIAGAMKGKRTIDTLRSAANDEVMRAKIEASRLANTIEANLNLLADVTEGYDFLFADKQELCLKDSEALAAIAKQRIADHKAEEERKAEAERERIRAEERERAEREAREAAQREAREVAEREKQAAAAQQQPTEANAGMQTPAGAAAIPQEELRQRQIDQAPQMQNAHPYRPTYDEIVLLVAEHYSVSINTAQSWIKEGYYSQKAA